MEVDVTVEETMARGCRSAEFVSSYDKQADSQDEKTRSGLTTKRIVTLSPARPMPTVSRMKVAILGGARTLNHGGGVQGGMRISTMTRGPYDRVSPRRGGEKSALR